jgi:hypothetical protein
MRCCICIRVKGLQQTLIFTRFEVQLRTPLRLTNAQRMTSFTICGITFELARHEIK